MVNENISYKKKNTYQITIQATFPRQVGISQNRKVQKKID